MWTLIVSSLGFGVVLASTIAVASMGFTVQLGLTNMLNLSYGAVMTVGAFVAYLAVAARLNAWLALVLGGCAGSLLTLFLGRSVFKVFARRGTKLFEMVMVTLGLSLIIEYAVQAISRGNIYQFTALQSSSIVLGPIIVTVTQLILVVLALVIFVGLEVLLRRTKLGKALRAMAADPSLARSCGIRTGQVVTITWLLTGFLCGISGVIYVINSQSVDYYTGQLFLPLVIAAAILGGVGSPGGAVVASLLMGLVTEIVSALGGSAYSSVAGFGILVIVLLSRPSSVIGGTAGPAELTL